MLVKDENGIKGIRDKMKKYLDEQRLFKYRGS